MDYEPLGMGRDAFHRVQFFSSQVADAVERVPTRFMESLLFILKRIGLMNLWWRRRVLSPLTKVARRGLRASTRFMFMGRAGAKESRLFALISVDPRFLIRGVLSSIRSAALCIGRAKWPRSTKNIFSLCHVVT